MSGDISPSMRKGADRLFRKLSKNDVYQTVEQWRERTLQELGGISGQWTAWVERNDVPQMPAERPRGPVKPTSEALMQPLKNHIRESRLRQRIEAELKASAAEGRAPVAITIDAIPMPNDYDAWAEYEERRLERYSLLRTGRCSRR